MYFGNTQITEMYLGTSPISEVWLGTTKVWNQGVVTTYEVVDPTLYYSSGTYLKSDASNYAYVLCTLKIYENGKLKETLNTYRMNVAAEGVTSAYLTYTDNLLKFNIAQYGTTDMSFQNNPMSIAIIPSAYGVTGATQYLKVEPNTIVSKELYDYLCSSELSTPFLTSTQTSFTITNKNVGYYTTKYTSGKEVNSTEQLPGYLFQVNQNTGTNTLLDTTSYGGTFTVNVGSTNTSSYPKIFLYRLSHNNSVSYYDDFIYIMQKSANNTSGLQVYYGTQKVNGWDIECSSNFYLANNGHTANTTYTITTTDPYIYVTERNGVFFVEASSSESGNVVIKDNSGNSCTFSINMYSSED